LVFNAIETHNGRNSDAENQKALKVAQTRELPSIGGSDCHDRKQVGKAFTVFPDRVRTIEELIGEIQKGNCRGSY